MSIIDIESQRKSKSKKEGGKMGITDRIEAFICELTKAEDGWVELGRNELAGIFNCVPSQINYVISTRFTPERGYAVESRRGGGGFIKIRRLEADAGDIIANLPEEMDAAYAKKIIEICLSVGMITGRDAKIINAAAQCDIDGRTRGIMMKRMLAAAVSC